VCKDVEETLLVRFVEETMCFLGQFGLSATRRFTMEPWGKLRATKLKQLFSAQGEVSLIL